MTDTDRELGLQEEDRLPWLEAVDYDDGNEDGVSGSKLFGFIVAALAALGLIIGGVWWLRSQQQAPGDGTLIAAQEGDYKVKPDDPGGMKVEGQGDAAFAASEGAEASGKLAAGSATENPVALPKPAAKPVEAAKPAAAKPVVTAALPEKAAALPSPSSGALVQLGAFNSAEQANKAWAGMTARNPQLARLSHSVIPAAVGGTTYYRLRANAGSAAAASALCARIGNCMVVRQ